MEINDRLLSAYIGLGVAQHALGHRDEALASFEMAAAVEPNSTLLFSETARFQLKVSVSQQLERYLDPQHLPDDQPVTQPVTDLMDRQIQHYEQLLTERPNYADLHYRLGLLFKQRGRLNEAIRSFEHAVTINPRYAKALIQLGITRYERNDLDQALAALQQALNVDPQSVGLHYQLGLLFADRHEFGLAVEQFEQALASDPKTSTSTPIWPWPCRTWA